MANFVSSILWPLGVICILVVPGFVEGKQELLNHLCFGTSKLKTDANGFYITENYKMADASTLHSNFVRLTPNKPNFTGYFFGESKIGQPLVGGVLSFRLLGNGGIASKHGNGLWMFMAKQPKLELKTEKGKLFFQGVAILINSKTPGKEAFEVFVNEIDFDKLGTPKSSSIGGCQGTTWFDKLLDRTDFSIRARLIFLIKEGKLSMDFANDLFGEWKPCLKDLDLNTKMKKGSIGDILTESYVTFAATTDSERMDSHDIMKFTILKEPDILFKEYSADNEHDLDEHMHSMTHGYIEHDFASTDEYSLQLLAQFMEHELHTLEERMDVVLDAIKEKEEHFMNIMKVVVETTTDNAGNALEERVAKVEKMFRDEIDERKESLVNLLESPSTKINIKEVVSSTLDEHNLSLKTLHWVMPFAVVSVTICIVCVVIYRKYVPILLMILTAYPKAQTALADTVSNYF